VAAVLAGARALAAGLTDAIHIVGASVIALTGGVAALGREWHDEVVRAVTAEALPEARARCRVEIAVAGYQAGAVGAGLLALGGIT
jgi:hypothetical protein